MILLVQGHEGLPVPQLRVAAGAHVLARVPVIVVVGAVVAVAVVVVARLLLLLSLCGRGLVALDWGGAVGPGLLLLGLDAFLAEAALAGEGHTLASGEGLGAAGAREACLCNNNTLISRGEMWEKLSQRT